MGPKTVTPMSLPTTRYLKTMPTSNPVHETASAIAAMRKAVPAFGTLPVCR